MYLHRYSYFEPEKITKTKRFPHHCIHNKDRYVIP